MGSSNPAQGSLAIKQEEAVAWEVNQKLADDKKMSKKEKDKR